VILTASLALVLLMQTARAQDHLREWGQETLSAINRDFPPAPDLWSAGVQFSALTAAAKVDPEYQPQAGVYSNWIFVHFGDANNLSAGLTAPPDHPKADRYYDDNAWIALDLIELYELTNEPQDLGRAKQVLQFVLSGEDDRLAGGIWWRLHRHETKNTCTNAPAIVAALRMYRLTSDENLLLTAKRLYAWVNAHLLDGDGLYFDHVKLDGSVDKTKFSYNTGLMIRADLLLAQITGDPHFLAEAHRASDAAIKRWVNADGIITDDAAFAHLLCGAFLKLSATDGNPKWRGVVLQSLDVLHARGRDPRGHYPKRWGEFPQQNLQAPPFIAQSSAARAYWEAVEKQ
jgi:hypothetical protein